MNFKELKNKIKQEQKDLAQKIRTCKPLRKPKNLEAASEETKQLCGYSIRWHSWEYRHKHIMYCHMFNNTPYDKIEQPNSNNTPSGSFLNQIRREWEEKLNEVVCDCA
jgi:hypothetical protein